MKRIVSASVLILVFALVAVCAQTSIHLNGTANPGSSAVGNVTSVTGAPWPAGVTAADVNVYLAEDCFGAVEGQTVATSLQTILGSTKRARFDVPSVDPGTYQVWVDGVAGDGFASDNCAQLVVN
jgi:hypothetical protein